MKMKTKINEDEFTLGMLKKVVPTLIKRLDKLEGETETFEAFKKRLILLLLDLRG